VNGDIKEKTRRKRASRNFRHRPKRERICRGVYGRVRRAGFEAGKGKWSPPFVEDCDDYPVKRADPTSLLDMREEGPPDEKGRKDKHQF